MHFCLSQLSLPSWPQWPLNISTFRRFIVSYNLGNQLQRGGSYDGRCSGVDGDTPRACISITPGQIQLFMKNSLDSLAACCSSLILCIALKSQGIGSCSGSNELISCKQLNRHHLIHFDCYRHAHNYDYYLFFFLPVGMLFILVTFSRRAWQL